MVVTWREETSLVLLYDENKALKSHTRNARENSDNPSEHDNLICQLMLLGTLTQYHIWYNVMGL